MGEDVPPPLEVPPDPAREETAERYARPDAERLPDDVVERLGRRRTGATAAAFFDLDKTIIARSSTLAFGRPFMKDGLLSPVTVLRGMYAQAVYQLVGADHDRMEQIRAAMLELTRGWEAERIRRIVRETMEEVVAPLVFQEALDLFEEHKDHVFVAPTVSLFHTINNNEAAGVGLTAEIGGYMGIPGLVEASVQTHTALRKRGIRHLIGGDYGFKWSPNGTNARDLQFFVDYYGYTPAEALRCATWNGGLAMGMGVEKLGAVQEGYLADLLLVDGDPLADLSVLLDTNRLVAIMKDGQFHKNAMHVAERRAAA